MPNFTGTSGNDIIEGTSGADTMTGLAGNDIYYVNSAGDLVVESSGQGTDTVRSTISYTLVANVEQLRLLGTANINATGNSLANLLVGNSGNNILDGGLNADTMKGGGGNDIYYVNSAGDLVVELGGEGTDTVRSEVSYTLGDNVEQLRLLGTANINATGNSLANLLVGNSGNNILDGGLNGDTMKGGEGNDIYYVNSSRDVVVELGGEGTDTVRSEVSYTLGGNVEQLRLLGSANISANGNDLANLLVGNSGDNTISGGEGADRLNGEDGDDILHGDGGNDLLSGGAGGDILDALEGDDVLVGGLGGDLLSGSTGADTFQFRSAADSTFNGYDLIAGFEAGIDVLDLSRIDADSTVDGNQAFFWAGGPSGPGSLWFDALGDGNYAFYGDIDGDNTADFYLTMYGPTFNFDDVIL